MSGDLTLPSVTFPTPGSVTKARFGTLPGTPNWAAFFMNAQYVPGSGWLLDDPNSWGMFLKLDVRSPTDNFALYRIPPGTGYHTNETPIITANNNDASVAFNGQVRGVAGPSAASDATNKGYVDSRIWKGTQAEYDALATKDPAVLYVVTG